MSQRSAIGKVGAVVTLLTLTVAACSASIGTTEVDAESPGWAVRFGGTGEEQGHNVVVDSRGNVYITGFFHDRASFESTSLDSAGGQDAFVASYTAAGALRWARRFGGPEDDMGRYLAVDGVDGLYVTGFFRARADFGIDALVSAGEQDIFVMYLSSAGEPRWVRRLGGSGADEGYAIVVDRSGQGYLAGFFSGGVDFGSVHLDSAGEDDAFVAALGTRGTPVWARRMGGPGSDEGLHLDAGADGSSLVLAGYFSGTADMGGRTLTSTGDFDGMVAGLSSAGTISWAQRMGGAARDIATGVAVDRGGVHVSGLFSGTGTFGGTTLPSAGDYDAFVAHLAPGGAFVGAQRFGGAAFDDARFITADADGRLFVTGDFWQTGVFGGTSLTSAGQGDLFLLALSSSTTTLWAERRGAEERDVGHSVAAQGRAIYVLGDFSRQVDFGYGPLSSVGGIDGFLLRIVR